MDILKTGKISPQFASVLRDYNEVLNFSRANNEVLCECSVRLRFGFGCGIGKIKVAGNETITGKNDLVGNGLPKELVRNTSAIIID